MAEDDSTVSVWLGHDGELRCRTCDRQLGFKAVMALVRVPYEGHFDPICGWCWRELATAATPLLRLADALMHDSESA